MTGEPTMTGVDAVHAVTAGLRVRNLSVAYGSRVVLRDISLDLAPGRIHGLIGPNGAGKSTLVKAVLGLVEHTGEVEVAGSPLRGMSPRQRALRMAYLAQDTSVTADFTGRQLVAMGRYARQSRFAVMSAEDVDAVSTALALTGADRWAERSVASTSGGERQLTGLARALAQEAPVLILDEPISALDMAHEMAVLRLLRPWLDTDPEHRSVVVVLHDLSVAARFCDELVLLAPSPSSTSVVAQGTPSQTLTPALLCATYGIEVDVRPSPVTGSLSVTPL